MEKSKHYYNVKFPAEVIEDAYNLFLKKQLHEEEDIKKPQELLIGYGNESWCFDSVDEFLAEYPKSESYNLDHIVKENRFIIRSFFSNSITRVTIRFQNRKDIESIFNVFEKNLDRSTIIVTSEPIKIFIGHGNSNQWRDLKGHLHEKHGYDVEAYEIGPRAGLTVKEVLETMLNKSSIAFLVLTGEDIDAYGEMHARENVIHELGLFQGRLGFKRAIALLEKDVHEFSNIFGLNQIRFSKGNIKETFGEVLATIKREFDQKAT